MNSKLSVFLGSQRIWKKGMLFISRKDWGSKFRRKRRVVVE